ncbi:D-alanyl-D-alanine carboxypeptidase family protein [Virgibacillus doumboii]|uniref:D-alanyl-D-alanine carboxypeptidase family protein n=1 Tax=Virgibacillus doumboii TaxID=2697503 RepID=UPI0013DFF450|nr:D-alanyl-D-alanine carboxypeptidase family protein [Virgibacillus doumboii]
MFNKKLAAALALFALLFIITACGDDESNNDQTAEPAPSSEKEDTTNKEAPEENTPELPKTTLHKTDQGDAVESLQEILNELGYSLSVNGTFDVITTWALTDFQLQQDAILPTGVYDTATKEALKKSLESDAAAKPASALAKPDNDKSVVSNPHEILTLVNKEHALPADFVPKNLVVPDVLFPFEEFLPKKQMRQVAATALEDMFQAADNAGLKLFAQSGYRSYDRQDAIFASNVEAYGEEAANNFSARPGESEHQSGLTMDVTSQDVGFKLIVEFGKTDEGKWLQQHAGEYGFIIRYPKGKEEITQYQYEPWHLRYVGQEAAMEITEKRITLEEYLGVK